MSGRAMEERLGDIVLRAPVFLLIVYMKISFLRCFKI